MLTAPWDFIAEEDVEEARSAFLRTVVDSLGDIVGFVDSKLGWNGGGEYDGCFAGSFNVSIGVRRGDTDERVLIRFCSVIIHPPWRDEKVKNEVMTMEFLREKTTMPIPPIHTWGLAEESPRQIGPFIIMDRMRGYDLSEFLQKPTENGVEEFILDPNIENRKLDIIYDQIAKFVLEISNLPFSKIGSISQDTPDGQWGVTGRPLTYDMNDAVTVGTCPENHFDLIKRFDRASDYFKARAQLLQAHLDAQRNIAEANADTAWRQFVARRCFEKLIPSYGAIDDAGPFRIYCDDMRPSNMLVDPDTLEITAVLDFEFTNALPAQYVYDVPWWLLLRRPIILLEKMTMEEFLNLFIPRKDQFIRAVERIEAQSGMRAGNDRLSVRMQESWDSGRFWFNLASRYCFDIDEIYWEKLHGEGMGEAMLDTETIKEKDNFIKMKMDQFSQYLAERRNDARFPP
ncbi:phosphotransferase enzyme family protein [Colletotrichum kahawae]|uniref:Phosphotransferase enzyme family protein n=1 Tax=Colletotrichum kahawae TaxID=34407 RepID=A0AAD9Y8Z2_COLKA|nr:phosphotransferase enzyme family protein [Colletotrichum kahawae]